MRKYLVSFCLLSILIWLLMNGDIHYERSLSALRLWFETLVPSLFCIMVIVKVLFAFHAFDLIAKVFSWLSMPLFHIGKQRFSYVIALMLLGFPAGAAFIDREVQTKRLLPIQAKRLLYTCSFATPGFVVMTIGSVLFHSVSIGLTLFAIQIFSGLVLLFMTRNEVIYNTPQQNSIPALIPTLKTAMIDSGIALYMMGGYLMLCMSICGVFLQYMPTFLQMPISVISEFSYGCVTLSALALPLSVRLILISMLLSFGGLCVHMQVISMSEHLHLRYGVYFCFRIMQALLSGFIAYLLF